MPPSPRPRCSFPPVKNDMPFKVFHLPGPRRVPRGRRPQLRPALFTCPLRYMYRLLCTCRYDLVDKLKEHLDKLRPQAVVLDEAHYIKNHKVVAIGRVMMVTMMARLMASPCPARTLACWTEHSFPSCPPQGTRPT